MKEKQLSQIGMLATQKMSPAQLVFFWFLRQPTVAHGSSVAGFALEQQIQNRPARSAFLARARNLFVEKQRRSIMSKKPLLLSPVLRLLASLLSSSFDEP